MLQKAELSGQADSENILGGSSQTMYFIGLDVHKKTISFCVGNAALRIIFAPNLALQRRMAPIPHRFLNHNEGVRSFAFGDRGCLSSPRPPAPAPSPSSQAHYFLASFAGYFRQIATLDLRWRHGVESRPESGRLGNGNQVAAAIPGAARFLPLTDGYLSEKCTENRAKPAGFFRKSLFSNILRTKLLILKGLESMVEGTSHCKQTT